MLLSVNEGNCFVEIIRCCCVWIVLLKFHQRVILQVKFINHDIYALGSYYFQAKCISQ